MTSKGYALARAELIRALTAYSGITTDDGAGDGTTLRDRNLIGRNDFITEKSVLIMSGDAKDEDKGAASFDDTTGIITVQGTGFSAQITAGTIYRILNISSVEIDVATINTKIGTNVDPAGTTTLFAWMAKIFADILGSIIIATGTFTGSSSTYPKDTGRTEVADYFNGCLLMPIAGVDAYQPRRIVDWVALPTGGFLLDPSNSFTLATGLVDYVVLAEQTEFVPGADATANRIPADVIGDKTDTALQTVAANASLMRYVKGLITSFVAIVGATGIFHEQADAAVNINAILASETLVINLIVANIRYIVRNLRLKCADPGANTVTVRLYELVNDVLTNVDSFAITNANFATYHSLMDMFGLPNLAGDNLRVTVQASAGGPYAVIGQYSHGKTNV